MKSIIRDIIINAQTYTDVFIPKSQMYIQNLEWANELDKTFRLSSKKPKWNGPWLMVLLTNIRRFIHDTFMIYAEIHFFSYFNNLCYHKVLDHNRGKMRENPFSNLDPITSICGSKESHRPKLQFPQSKTFFLPMNFSIMISKIELGSE